ncbi:MAG: hypothetical protein WBQ34_16345 [Candidatus Acidiferrales bacterium]
MAPVFISRYELAALAPAATRVMPFAEETIANRLVSVHYVGAHASSLVSTYLFNHPGMVRQPRTPADRYHTSAIRLYLTRLTQATVGRLLVFFG